MDAALLSHPHAVQEPDPMQRDVQAAAMAILPTLQLLMSPRLGCVAPALLSPLPSRVRATRQAGSSSQAPCRLLGLLQGDPSSRTGVCPNQAGHFPRGSQGSRRVCVLGTQCRELH